MYIYIIKQNEGIITINKIFFFLKDFIIIYIYIYLLQIYIYHIQLFSSY